MTKKFNNAPLPFQGQKRRFIRQLEEMAKRQNEGTIFIDLFGGSGLVSHTIKRARPDCRVVYNDYDHYSDRLANVARTNAMLRGLRDMLAGVPQKARITSPLREAILEEVAKWQRSGYVDWVSLSSNILFTMNYVSSYDELAKATLYNRVRQTDYDAEGYLEGVETVSMDYRQLFALYRDVPEVVFVLDPPYLSTDCGTYKDYWRLSDYLDVLKCLNETRFVYFTSSKSSIVELATWMSENKMHGNPFEGACEHRFHVSGQALNYDDIMLDKTAA